jgi:HicA toxin of bacterial toxin-antitoxin,
MSLGRRHCRTLCRIFERPIRADVEWDDFVALVKKLGGRVSTAGRTSGSAHRAPLNGRRAVLHKPHPDPRMKKGSVGSARDFLTAAGVTPGSQGCAC